MPTRHRRRSRFAFLLLPLLLSAVALYFGWQSTRGDFSRAARQELIEHRAAREAELALLVEERRRLEARVERLRTSALDADLLDERARAQLNLSHPGELVIFHRFEPDGAARMRADGPR